MLDWLKPKKAPASAVQEISADELEALLKSSPAPFVVDVREADEVAAGMIPGAVHIPMGAIPQRLAELPHDRQIVTVCASGSRSWQVAKFLLQKGWGNVKSLRGGMGAWGNRG